MSYYFSKVLDAGFDEAIEKVAFTEQKKALAHIQKYYIDDTPPEILRVET